MLSCRPRLTLIAAAGFLALAACSPDSAPASDHVHEHGEDHDHHEGERAEDHHEHEGEDHGGDHAHDSDSSGAGSAHVHGAADLALTWEGNVLTAELVSPLANFGLSESDGQMTEVVRAALPALVTLSGGDCAARTPEARVDTSTGHTDAHVSLTWSCGKPDGVAAVTFSGFTPFPGFETIHAVYLTDTDQKAGELSPSAPALSLK